MTTYIITILLTAIIMVAVGHFLLTSSMRHPNQISPFDMLTQL